MEQALSIISITLSTLSIAYIIRMAYQAFSPYIHITSLTGPLIILTLSISDLLIAVNAVKLSRDFTSIHFLTASLTSILSCYILLQVGMNFYQDNTFLKLLLVLVPIILLIGVFILSVVVALQMILGDSNQTTTTSLKNIIFILSAISGLFSLIYGIIPLFVVRSQTKLNPQQTAVSVVRFFIVVIFFVAHLIVYAIVTFNSQMSDLTYSIIQNMVLIPIFPGCSFTPPKRIVKFVKREVLGVEELTIGGEFRLNMLPDNYTNSVSSVPSNSQLVSSNLSDNPRRNINRKRLPRFLRFLSLTKSSTPLSEISSPTPLPSSTPNSTSPRQRVPPFPSTSRSIYIDNNNNVDMNKMYSLNSDNSDASFYLSKFFDNPNSIMFDPQNSQHSRQPQHSQHSQYPQYPQYPQRTQYLQYTVI